MHGVAAVSCGWSEGRTSGRELHPLRSVVVLLRVGAEAVTRVEQCESQARSGSVTSLARLLLRMMRQS